MSEVLHNALWSALFAGVVATGVTVAIERFGGRLGGLLGTLPTTIVPASIGIWSQTGGGDAFAAAMDATPAGMLVDAVFLWLWRELPGRLPKMGLRGTLAAMTVLTLGAWALLAWPVVLWGRSFAPGQTWVFGVGATALLIGAGIAATRRSRPSPKGNRGVRVHTLALRGVFAALAIGVAVWIAEVAGPVAAGIAAVFPAIFYTSMASLWVAQGHAVPAGAVGPMMLGSSSVAVYALLAHFSFPAVGVAAGATLAWLGAVITTTVPAWLWLEHRAKLAVVSEPSRIELGDG